LSGLTEKPPTKVLGIKRTYVLIPVCIVAALAIAAVAWFVSSTGFTLGRISGRAWTAVSRSMEPADIDLITYRKLDGELMPKDNPVRWHLRLPRAFIVSMSQPPGVPFDTSNGEENSKMTFIGVNLQFDNEKQDWVPSVLKKPTGKGFVSFRVTNTSGYIALGRREGKCHPQDKFRELQLPLGLGAPANTKCDIRNNRCQIVTDLDQWQIKMTVSADLYKDHEKTCGMVRDFLNKHTLLRTPR
jgi:hypothetical protein